MNLTDEQRHVVTTDAKYVRCIAGPGSGKTTTMAERVRYLVRTKRVSPYYLCLITFTRSGATELKERVKKLMDGSGHNIGKAFMGTSHSLAVRILRQWGERIGYSENFTIYDEVDRKDIIKDIGKALGLKAKQITVIKCINSTVVDDPPDHNAMAIALEYHKRLRDNNAFDFDLLLFYANKLLREHQDIRAFYHNLFDYMIYDEFQDIAEEEYEMIRLIDPSNLMVVGDPNQELYAFRGTSNKFLLNRLPEDYPDIETMNLTLNFRSRKEIVDVANNLISHNPDQIEDPAMKAVRTGYGEIQFKEFPDKDHEAKEISDILNTCIFTDHKRGPVKYSSVAILFRTNRQSERIANALRERKIPCQVVNSSLKFYQRPEIKRFIQHLQVIHNPADNYAASRVVSENMDGVHLSEMQEKRIRKDLTVMEAASDYIPDKIHSLDLIRGLIKSRSLVTVLEIAEALESELGFARYYAALGLTTKAESINSLFAFLKDWQEQNPEDHTLRAFIEWYGMKTATDLIKKNLDAVQIMTAHMAKGREFPIVIIAGFSEGLMPLKSGTLEEERRLAYVAITRAEDELYITSPLQSFGMDVDRSRFLGEMMG